MERKRRASGPKVQKKRKKERALYRELPSRSSISKPKWRAAGYDVESSASGDAILKASAASEAIGKVYHGQAVGPITFQTRFQPHLVWSLDQVKKNIEDKTHQHIDARSKPRFDGAVPEPRKGIRSGHVPGSKCIPFPQTFGRGRRKSSTHHRN